VVSEVLARVDGVCGELVLRRAGPHHEIIANGVFLMDTRNGESERLMVTAAADRMPPGATMLIGGLGVGFSLRAALTHSRVGSVVVVEREQAVIDWNHDVLGNAEVLAEPRVRVVHDDLLSWLPSAGRFGALCLDIDNGPEWTVDDGNASLYGGSGLAMIDDALAPGGVLAVWSAGGVDELAGHLRARLTGVEVLEVPVARGEPDVVVLGSLPG